MVYSLKLDKNDNKNVVHLNLITRKLFNFNNKQNNGNMLQLLQNIYKKSLLQSTQINITRTSDYYMISFEFEFLDVLILESYK